ncbi:hypothetical protein F3Y22_tig00111410pilonHSYRG00030 [Hibiscus syriacus]|uniref:HAT C-terminal dimerisation domain-containing protein n=1 Tax=Hibiscus syriacus TaxID=106335 RepID=A0A6A2YFT7_HIBSY|nr:hypothetical protein F3Y22_tig00111410pilonHSYRG00030 [Hibiscus syriacus]
MPPREEFPTKGLEGAPSNDIGWHFGTPVPNARGSTSCKLYGKVVKGGITRFKEHIAHKTGNVAPCPNVTSKQLEKASNHNMSGIEEKNSDEVLVVGVIFMKKGDLPMDQLEDIVKKEQVHPSRVSLSLPYEELHLNWLEVQAQNNQSKGTVYWKSMDVSSVRSRDDEFYYNLLDSVVKEIGESYIVQIVTDNEATMKAAEKNNEFKESKCGQQKTRPAYEAKKIILGKDFWKKANDLIKVYEPLVKVLRLMDSDEKPTMSFIYEAVDRAKRAIQQDCRYFTEYEKIIDNRWNFMHSDLHSAGTRLVIERLEPSLDTQIRMVNQLLLFRDKHETFGTPQAQRAWRQMNPFEWWIIYGTCVPELQRLAIKVLSQTTTASNCERNWSTFSYIHTKARNRLKYKRLEKLVFTYYNMRLQIRHQKRTSIDDINTSFNPINLDHIFEDVDPLLEWLQEKENPLLDGEIVGMLPVDTSDDETNVDESQQQNLANSSSSATPSQSGDGLDGGGLSPIDDDDDDDNGGGGRDEIRSSS